MKRFTKEQLKYLKLLANQYPNINAASTEIINLQAILNLPKGTEHFVSDVHGEFDAFNHVLRNASGVIKSKINDIFGKTLMENEKKALATLIYYPERKLESISKKMPEEEMHDWYRVTLFRLVKICKEVATKYTRSKVRKALPPDFSYIIQELIHEDMDEGNKHMYYAKIIDTIISLGRAEAFIVAISNVIHRLAIDRLHVIGDIYDRGNGAAKIMDLLLNYHSLDIQWGNHDISWMGAAAGNKALICNTIRIAARYANLDTIEEDYGINLVPLATFAMDSYQDDPCSCFLPKVSGGFFISKKETDLIAKMHKAITVLQFKMEAEIIKRRPEYELNHMMLLDKMDLANATVMLDGKEYPLLDNHFPTVNPQDPYKLTKEEEDLMEKLVSSFSNSAKLQEHTRLLFNKGSMYSVFNTSLLFHGCIPILEDGTFEEATLFSEKYKGKELMDQIERTVRAGYFNRHNLKGKLFGMDMMWYLWCGPVSPLFGKKKVTTFERYFIQDTKTHQEEKNPYYHLRNEEAVCRKILEEFGVDPDEGHIINGHVPVKVSKGEEPIKANGKLYVIDGGFAKAYQDVTGIAGYTLIYNSRGLVLVAHEPFVSMEKSIEEEQDIVSEQVSSEYVQSRQLVMNTDIGKSLMENISQLEDLLLAYQTGLIKEQE